MSLRSNVLTFFANRWIALGIFVLISIIFCLPILCRINYLGQMDWDESFFWNAVARETILKYHQFPLWNPYCQNEGALVFLAYPNSHFLSPFFLLVLIFGAVVSVKINIILHLIIGLWGMFLLSRYLRLGIISSYVSSFIFICSAIYPLHLTEGHLGWLTMGFVPWLFLCYIKSVKNIKFIFGCILFLSLILLGGSVDVFIIIIVFLIIYSFFLILQNKRIIFLKRLIIIYISTFLLCAIKLFPMLEYLYYYSPTVESQDEIQLKTLPLILLAKDQAELYAQTKWSYADNQTPMNEKLGIKYGWHEYGAYVGEIALILFGVGVLFSFRRHWPLFLTGAIFLFLALGNKSPVNLWKALAIIPPYGSVRVPSRFILGFIFSLSLHAGFGLSRLEAKANLPTYILVILTSCFMLSALFLVNGPIFKQAFTVPAPLEVEKNYLFSHQEDFDDYTYTHRMRGGRYLAFLANKGVLKKIYDDIPVPEGKIIAKDNSNYKGEAYLAKGKGKISIHYFSPNKLVVDAKIKQEGILVLNQKYYKGWQIKGNVTNVVKSFNGLISTTVLPGKYRLTFYYLPFSFIAGTFVSILTVLTCLVLLWRIFAKNH